MLLPVVLYYLVFHYGPMYGAVIAFQDFNPVKGVFGSKWVGLQNFQDFFSGVYFGRLMFNTLAISVLEIVFGFPAPIILALLINELRWNPFRRLVQTVTYLPHFISIVVIVGMMYDFFARDGLTNQLLSNADPIAFMQSPEWFRQLFVGSGIWQQVGWRSIVYLAAIAAIDAALYEAAKVDGANRFRQIRHITIPQTKMILSLLLMLQVVATMQMFIEAFILTGGPGVNNNTLSVVDLIYIYAFSMSGSSNYNSASALGVVLMLVLGAFSGAYLWLSRERG